MIERLQFEFCAELAVHLKICSQGCWLLPATSVCEWVIKFVLLHLRFRIAARFAMMVAMPSLYTTNILFTFEHSPLWLRS